MIASLRQCHGDSLDNSINLFSLEILAKWLLSSEATRSAATQIIDVFPVAGNIEEFFDAEAQDVVHIRWVVSAALASDPARIEE